MSPSGVSGGRSCEADVGDNGPLVDVWRKEVLRILDWRDREGWRPCGARLLGRVSASSPIIGGGEMFSGESTVSASACGKAFVAAWIASLNAASSGSVSA